MLRIRSVPGNMLLLASWVPAGEGTRAGIHLFLARGLRYSARARTGCCAAFLLPSDFQAADPLYFRSGFHED